MRRRIVQPQFVDFHDGELYSGMGHGWLRAQVRAGVLTAYRPAGGKILLDLKELDQLIRRGAGQPTTRGKHLLAESAS